MTNVSKNVEFEQRLQPKTFLCLFICLRCYFLYFWDKNRCLFMFWNLDTAWKIYSVTRCVRDLYVQNCLQNADLLIKISFVSGNFVYLFLPDIFHIQRYQFNWLFLWPKMYIKCYLTNFTHILYLVTLFHCLFFAEIFNFFINFSKVNHFHDNFGEVKN